MSVKAALLHAFDEAGGVEALTEFARKNPAEFFRLWIKLLPTKIDADVRSWDLSKMTDDEIKALYDLAGKAAPEEEDD